MRSVATYKVFLQFDNFVITNYVSLLILTLNDA